jgi:hypothetical protein
MQQANMGERGQVLQHGAFAKPALAEDLACACHPYQAEARTRKVLGRSGSVTTPKWHIVRIFRPQLWRSYNLRFGDPAGLIARAINEDPSPGRISSAYVVTSHTNHVGSVAK